MAPAKLAQFWELKHSKAFCQLREITKNVLQLKIIESGPPSGIIHIYHNSSSKVYIGILTQEMMTESGKIKEYPLHYFSRLHQGSENNYSIPES